MLILQNLSSYIYQSLFHTMDNFYTLYVGVNDDRNFKLILLPAKCNESQLKF